MKKQEINRCFFLSQAVHGFELRLGNLVLFGFPLRILLVSFPPKDYHGEEGR